MTIPMIAQGPFRAEASPNAWDMDAWQIVDIRGRVFCRVYGETASHDAPILADMLNEKARRDYRIQQDGR